MEVGSTVGEYIEALLLKAALSRTRNEPNRHFQCLRHTSGQKHCLAKAVLIGVGVVSTPDSEVDISSKA
eukprot:195011-Amphidinium_carterae.1